MSVKLSIDRQQYKGVLSFEPVLNLLQKHIDDKKLGAEEMYGYLLRYAKEHPELLAPITDISLLDKHTTFVAQMMATIFPPMQSDKKILNAAFVPFGMQSVYASEEYRKLFLNEDNVGMVFLPTEKDIEELEKTNKITSYIVIYNYYNNQLINEPNISIHKVIDPIEGFTRYVSLEVVCKYLTPKLIDKNLIIDPSWFDMPFEDFLQIENLEEKIPVDAFEYHGMTIIDDIVDVTERETINIIKDNLIRLNAFSEEDEFESLQSHIKNLIGINSVAVGMSPFIKVNEHLVFPKLNMNRSITEQDGVVSEEEKLKYYAKFLKEFSENKEPILIQDIATACTDTQGRISQYVQLGFKSIIICPLYNDDELIGILEVACVNANTFHKKQVNVLKKITPLFSIALQKGSTLLDNMVDKVLKEKFTAIHQSVEWKFTEVALQYILQKVTKQQASIDKISFENIFPLYGAIDIKNSSIIRNETIAKDLVSQLQMVESIISEAILTEKLPLLQEIKFKTEKYIINISKGIQTENEYVTTQFLLHEVPNVFQYLRQSNPVLVEKIDQYHESINNEHRTVYKERAAYEESIGVINKMLAQYLDAQQEEAQKNYPFYFERYVTDGVEFNAYIGQSIQPNIKFDFLFLKNLKMWQLTTLINAAKLIHSKQNELKYPLQTTQLILAHKNPIAISFRMAEKRFDVDGSYNIRYEIIKKRIDKIKIYNTEERLTKPNTISIVYSQQSEADEYKGYIEYLQYTGLLEMGIEMYQLEEMQGVSGLKGLRININMA